MMQDEFERWLIDTGYKLSTASQYALAINRLSSHFSEMTGALTDIYHITDIGILGGIADKYCNGIYRDKGYEGNGTNRAAIQLYEDYIRRLNGLPASPRRRRRQSEDNLRAELEKRIEQLAAHNDDLRDKGRRAVADRDQWEAKARNYEIEVAKLKTGIQRAKAAISKCLHPNAHSSADEIEVELRAKIFKEVWPEIEKIDRV